MRSSLLLLLLLLREGVSEILTESSIYDTADNRNNVGAQGYIKSIRLPPERNERKNLKKSKKRLVREGVSEILIESSIYDTADNRNNVGVQGYIKSIWLPPERNERRNLKKSKKRSSETTSGYSYSTKSSKSSKSEKRRKSYRHSPSSPSQIAPISPGEHVLEHILNIGLSFWYSNKQPLVSVVSRGFPSFDGMFQL
jgi:hypothetical protein